MIRCKLVGGPYDGAWFDAPHDLPEHWWIRQADGKGGQFDLLARPWADRGGVRYVLSAFVLAEAVYQHESVHTDVGMRDVESFA